MHDSVQRIIVIKEKETDIFYDRNIGVYDRTDKVLRTTEPICKQDPYCGTVSDSET